MNLNNDRYFVDPKKESEQIYVVNLQLSYKSKQSNRRVQSYFGALSDVGGLFDIIFLFIMTLYAMLVKPLDHLNLLREF